MSTCARCAHWQHTEAWPGVMILCKLERRQCASAFVPLGAESEHATEDADSMPRTVKANPPPSPMPTCTKRPAQRAHYRIGGYRGTERPGLSVPVQQPAVPMTSLTSHSPRVERRLQCRTEKATTTRNTSTSAAKQGKAAGTRSSNLLGAVRARPSATAREQERQGEWAGGIAPTTLLR